MAKLEFGLPNHICEVSETSGDLGPVIKQLNVAYMEVFNAMTMSVNVLDNSTIDIIDEARNNLVKVIDMLWQKYAN